MFTSLQAAPKNFLIRFLERSALAPKARLALGCMYRSTLPFWYVQPSARPCLEEHRWSLMCAIWNESFFSVLRNFPYVSNVPQAHWSFRPSSTIIRTCFVFTILYESFDKFRHSMQQYCYPLLPGSFSVCSCHSPYYPYLRLFAKLQVYKDSCIPCIERDHIVRFFRDMFCFGQSKRQ